MVISWLPETHWGIILDRRARKLKAEGEDAVSPMEHGKPPREVFQQFLIRPVKVLLPLVLGWMLEFIIRCWLRIR